MARYYYDRYRVSTSTYYTEGSWSTPSYAPVASDYKIYGHSSYDFNSSTGQFSTSGPQTYVTVASTGYAMHTTSGSSITARYGDKDGSQYYVVSTSMSSQSHSSYVKGSYIDTITAEDGTFPDNGRVGTTYWYVKKGRAFPELVVKADGQVKQGVDGWVKVEGELKRIVQMWTKTGGQLKES